MGCSRPKCEQNNAIEHSTGLLPGLGGFGAIAGAGHEFDLTNKGCYGVDLEYTKPLFNNGSETGYVHVGLVARNVVTYFGAAHVSSPEPVVADKRYVPPLAMPDPPTEPRREMVDLLQSRTGMKIAVAPDQEAAPRPRSERRRLRDAGQHRAEP